MFPFILEYHGYAKIILTFLSVLQIIDQMLPLNPLLHNNAF